MGDVVTSDRFGLTPERVDELKDKGLIQHDLMSYEDMDLMEPSYGEETIGNLTHEEHVIFNELHTSQRELDDKTRDIVGTRISQVGDVIRTSDRSQMLSDAVKDKVPEDAFDTDEEAEEYFALEQKRNYLRMLFYFSIGERLKSHSHLLGIRTKGRIVTFDKRSIDPAIFVGSPQ
jgi:hypothetical protein